MHKLVTLFCGLILVNSYAKTIELSPLFKDDQMQTMAWKLHKGLRNPESAYYDSKSDSIFVSNVAGNGETLDATGWITKLDSSGKVIKEKWIEGLSAPKGMAADKDFLWVADIKTIVKIDKKKAKVVKFYHLPDAKFLNDLAIDSAGNVYVTDTLTSKIYIVKGNKAEIFLSGKELNGPTGIIVDKDKLVVASWGLTTDWKTKDPGHIYTVDIKKKKVEKLNFKVTGKLDGIVKDQSLNYLVSDWMKGTITKISPDGKSSVLYQGPKGVSDIGLVPQKSLLLIPAQSHHYLWAVELKKHKNY